MNKIIDYISNPATWIAFCVFLFWLWGTYVSLNDRLDAIEEQQEKQEKQLQEFDVIGIKVQLKEIQTDLQWLKSEWMAQKK